MAGDTCSVGADRPSLSNLLALANTVTTSPQATNMQLLQLLLVTIIVLLASGDVVVTASKCGVKTTATNEATNKAQPEYITPHPKLTKLTATDEERGGVSIGAAARANGGAAVPINGPSEDVEMVTVTTYNGNGVWQKMKKWWNGMFGANKEPSRSTRRLRQ
ncbi:hypothetical protein ON010_g1358 [Phytophthora cinnamomi]|nr:hypothetical protein ON010_g1358 [Phytophthora cinnamomi]